MQIISHFCSLQRLCYAFSISCCTLSCWGLASYPFLWVAVSPNIIVPDSTLYWSGKRGAKLRGQKDTRDYIAGSQLGTPLRNHGK